MLPTAPLDPGRDRLDRDAGRPEIEAVAAALERHPEVAEAAVVVTGQAPGARQLWAYVVRRREDEAGPPHLLPSGLAVFHLNKNETEHLHQQIFDSRIYLRHGIALPDEACVLDVGANIGLFTLFCHCVCERPRLLAFEPSPPAFARLRRNVELYGLAVELEPCAVSDREGTAPFTLYPRASVMSGLYADPAAEERLFRQFVGEQLREEAEDPEIIPLLVDELAAGRFATRVVERRLRTVSSVISQHGIDRVDLLKVDAEKSELDIFSGILPEHWDRILQVAAEVHADRWLPPVVSLLEGQGFIVVTEQDASMRATEIHHVYARRTRPADGRAWHDRPRHALTLRDARPSPAAGVEALGESLREVLRRAAPAAAPAGVIFLEELPRLADGRVDRSALPRPGAAAAPADGRAR